MKKLKDEPAEAYLARRKLIGEKRAEANRKWRERQKRFTEPVKRV